MPTKTEKALQTVLLLGTSVSKKGNYSSPTKRWQSMGLELNDCIFFTKVHFKSSKLYHFWRYRKTSFTAVNNSLYIEYLKNKLGDDFIELSAD